MALPIGSIVRLDSPAAPWGVVVRGPRRASRGMLWVLWEDREAPMHCQRIGLRYIARRGPIDRVKAALEAMALAAKGLKRDIDAILGDRS